ncbi:uncharacterized protein LOC144433930 [Glandiceps talaboti]
MVDTISSFFGSLGRRRGNSQPSTSPQQQQRSGEREEDGFVFLGNTHSERNTRDSDYQPDAPPTYASQTGLPSFDEAIAARENDSYHQTGSLRTPGSPHQQPMSYDYHQTGSLPTSGNVNQHPVYQPMSLPGSHVTGQQPMSSHIQNQHMSTSCHGNHSMQSNCDGKQTVGFSSLVTADDIPFELSLEMEVIANVSTLGSRWLYVPSVPHTNSAQYHYDFACEKAVMKETACMDNTGANLDRTTSTQWTSGSQSTNSSYSRTNVNTNLMSFD